MDALLAEITKQTKLQASMAQESTTLFFQAPI